MNDDLTSRFAELGTLDVPRPVDLDAVRAGGRKRLRRRRMFAGAAATGAVAAVVASAVAVSGALLTDPGQGSPQAPAAGGSQQPTAKPTVKPTGTSDNPAMTPRPSAGPGVGPGSDPLAGWTKVWQERMRSHGLRLEANASMSDLNRGETEMHGAVRRGQGVGYAAFMGTTDAVAVRKARANPCRISRFPKDGTGGQCRQQGDYWVKTYADSDQGRVVLVRVVTDRADVLLAQSTGFPSYKSSVTDSVNLLPWDLRDPVFPEDQSKRRNWPDLDHDPLPTADLAAVAKDLARSAPR